MNELKKSRDSAVISCRDDGTSGCSMEAMTSVHRGTNMRLLVRAGDKFQSVVDITPRNFNCNRLQVDEIWN